jgi:hypothetical protein
MLLCKYLHKYYCINVKKVVLFNQAKQDKRTPESLNTPKVKMTAPSTAGTLKSRNHKQSKKKEGRPDG